ncbi:MAG: 16S rRNA (uracil(1498)-N(3))-methyltransferase [Rhodospirillales bacterium]|nr:16S rRNA (uracil(1498)-N(3))-methyltransferase [Rhodospirillales bacterium]
MNGAVGEAAIEQARIRLYVAADLEDAAAVQLSASQTHYLRTVMRLQAGASVRLFNSRHGEWLASLRQLRREDGEATVIQQLRRQRAEPGPALLFAPLKKDPMDFVVIKATELGVTQLTPVFTQRTATQRVNIERLRAQVIEAAEQCGRLSVPEVHPAIGLDRALATWTPDRRLWVADPAAREPILAAFAADGRRAGATPAVLIGPEGGLAANELDRLAALPFVSLVHLGPRVLRAETAALAALACWQAIAGDWRACDDNDSPSGTTREG